MNPEIDLKNIMIHDIFWTEKQNLVTDIVIPFQEKILNDKIVGVEKSHAFANFRIAAGLEKGEYYGMVFQDSDVAKWLEGVAYSLTVKPDIELEKRADDIIEIIERAQQADGYLNTYFTIKEPEHRWQNLHECHELYCAGHMMEAAVAYYEATGKNRLLKVMERMAEHIESLFGADKCKGIPGHQEIEIGLMRLYHVTKKEKYCRLAQYFVDQRGKNPNYFAEEKIKRGWSHFGLDPSDTKYNQCFAPVRDQKTAEGHSVRAVYMYTAMADIAGTTNDRDLYKACETIWDNIINRRMYITGGIGSTMHGEAFTFDYDLPNDTIYAETCASIGLIFFAKKMLDIKPSNKFADTLERAFYNGVISGMQLDGKRFFYVNPLEVNPEISGKLFGHRHVLPERPEWYSCACCPPNVVRLLMSLGKYAWSVNGNTIYSHLFIGGSIKLNQTKIEVESEYPWNGKIRYRIHDIIEKYFTLSIRIPSHAKATKIFINDNELVCDAQQIKDGYIYMEREWKEEDCIHISFDMPVRRIYANTAVRADSGCVSLMRGPLVYCFEGVDHDCLLQELRIPDDAEIQLEKCEKPPLKSMVILKINGQRVSGEETLYSENKPLRTNAILTAIPYFAWGNRGKNQMRVWVQE